MGHKYTLFFFAAVCLFIFNMNETQAQPSLDEYVAEASQGRVLGLPE